MSRNTFGKLIAFLGKLDHGKISYTLAHHRDDAIMVIAVVPGERWEIEFFQDGSVEVERFISDGEIYGEEALAELLTTYSDQEPESVESIEGVELAAATK